MDTLGPLHIRLTWRTLQEAQVVISTCTTARAVHLELITSKASKASQMEFCPFVMVRGHPNFWKLKTLNAAWHPVLQ